MFPTSLRWVEGIEPARLALSPRPRGGDDLQDEILAWRAAGVEKVVSFLEPREARDLGLALQPDACSRAGVAFLQFPIPDRGVPGSQREVLALTRGLTQDLRSGVGIALHCRAGIGRTGLIAGCLLHLLRVPSSRIFATLSLARGVSVPDTEEQVAWVAEFCRRATSVAS